MRHQGMRSIERLLDRLPAMTLLALRHVVLGEIEIIENSVGIRPLLEQIIVLEEMVVTEGRVRDHQRLHGRGIFFHQIGNARRAVDHDLIGEAHKPFAVERLVMREVLAERPVLVEQRHAGRGIGIQHLLRGDHLDLVRVGVEPEFGSRNLLARIVDTLQLRRSPTPLPQTGVRLSRSWRDLLLFSATLKKIVKHGKDFAAVVDLAHRQRRAIGAQALIQRPKR